MRQVILSVVLRRFARKPTLPFEISVAGSFRSVFSWLEVRRRKNHSKLRSANWTLGTIARGTPGLDPSFS